MKAQYAYIHREEGNHPGAFVMCCLLEVSHTRSAAPWRNRGMSDIPQSAVEEFAIFMMYSFNESKQTRLVSAGPQNPWCAVALQSARRRYARLMQPRGIWRGPPRKVRTTAAAADLAGHPDLIKRNFTADAPAQKPVGDYHPQTP